MIREIRYAMLLKPVFDLAHHIEDITPEKFKSIVCDRLTEKTSVMIVDEFDNEVRGFIFCTVDCYQGGRAFVMQYAYVAPDKFLVGAELFHRARMIAKEGGFKETYMMTSRSPEGFIRKYKFEISKYVLKRSV